MRHKRSEVITAEAKRFGSLIAIGLLIGFALDHLFLGLLFANIVYFTLILREISAFYDWLEGRRANIPEDNAFLFDVAERIYFSKRKHRRIKSRIRDQLRRVEDSTSALNDGVLITSGFDQLSWWNKAAEEMLHLSKGSDLGQSVTNFIRAPHFIEYLKKGDFEKPIDVAPSYSEHVTLQIQVTNFGEAERLFVVRDVTKVLHLEKMRKDFVGNVSHELRTPLTVLKGYFENLSMITETLPQPLINAMKQMSGQVERMNDTVSDLMLLSKLDEQDEIDLEQTVNLCEIVNQAFHSAELAASPQHKFILELQDCEIKGVASELYSAFSNIIYNAIKYSPEGGEILLKLTISEETVVVSVSDQGVGIDPKHISRLTERFYRADSARTRDIGGTGLGLAITKHVLMRHQAQLKIESWPGEGSKFSCIFNLK